jgi:hypothetical protein
MLRAITFSWVLMTSSVAFALDTIPGEDMFSSLVEKDGMGLAAGMGVGKIGDALFLKLDPAFEFNMGPIGFGVHIPLNLSLEGGEGDVLRKEDWDEPTEFLRILRYFRFGQKRDTVYVRVGELAASVGHGTIVGRYINNIDINTYHMGLQADFNTDYGGLETLLSDVGAVSKGFSDTKLFAGRLYVKPISFIMAPDSPLNIFAVGASVAVDVNAPNTLSVDEAGNPVVDEENNFSVAQEKQSLIWGLDVEAEVFNNSLVELVPYIDFNMINGLDKGGWGFHMGAMAKLKLPVGLDLTIPLRLEYRRFAGNYIPAYFGSFYDNERFSYPLGAAGNARTKRAYLSSITNTDGLNGWFGESAFDVGGYAQVGALYEDYDTHDGTPGGTLSVFMNVPATDFLQAKAYYTRSKVEGPKDLFKLDERSLLTVQASGAVPDFPYLWLVLRFTRQWVVNDTGAFVSQDDWDAGVEFKFQL